MEWTYSNRNIDELSDAEKFEIYELFDFKTNFPTYGKVSLAKFIDILHTNDCFQIYSDGKIAGLLYFEPLNGNVCKFHFAILRPKLAKNRGYIKIVNEILDNLLDKSNKACYNCIYGYTPFDEVARYSKLLGFKVFKQKNVKGITILIKEN